MTALRSLVGVLALAATSAATAATVTLDPAPLAPAKARAGGEEAAAPRLVPVPGELVVELATDAPVDDAVLAGLALDGGATVERLMQWTRRNRDHNTLIVHVRGAGGVLDADAATRGLARLGRVVWAVPNRAYLGDPRELVPNDPQFPSQYHHPLMQNDLAWDVTLGSPSIVVAVTDDGLATTHEDLVGNVWTNPNEIPGNGVDDDFNGYVDDVVGWDCLHDDNDPDPNSSSDDHGTHCAGIVGADTDNGLGVAGTAGATRLMGVQFYSGGESWTAANIAEAFAYAADNGARITTTSYNMDIWVGDEIVFAAFDYLYDNGVLHFNSAGNGNSLNPPRQIFVQSLLVASTDSGDVRSSFSNYGDGVDLAAPGSSVLSTVTNDGYGTKSGTSMASPNAAGVAALVWAANPDWTRDQVAAQVYATADSIDAQNPSLVGLLGGGRVNGFRGVTETVGFPSILSATGLPEEGSLVTGELGSVVVRFDQIMDPASVRNPAAFRLTYAGLDGTFGTADDEIIPLEASEYLVGSNDVTITPTAPFPAAGLYRIAIRGTVLQNPFGGRLDADGDGAAGGDLAVEFLACSQTIVLDDDLESGAGWTVENVAITDGGWDASPSVPVGGGDRSDPPTDFDGSGRCFLTDNEDGNSDVDGGPTILTSYAIDLSAEPDPFLSYARWYGTDETDPFRVEISNDDGASWTLLEQVTGNQGWAVNTFRVADVLEPTATVRLRFIASDNPNDSVVEAGVDQIRVIRVSCEPPGDPADLDGDGTVGLGDLIVLLAAWGDCDGEDPCPADLSGDGLVGLDDLLILLSAWD